MKKKDYFFIAAVSVTVIVLQVVVISNQHKFYRHLAEDKAERDQALINQENLRQLQKAQQDERDRIGFKQGESS